MGATWERHDMCELALRRTTRTQCHVYTLLPPDDGLQADPKHVEV
jgi:hypothetical protein